jgi:hypothetical protein
MSIVWIVEPTDKFPEWIEFEGKRFPCKLTPKGITMTTGRTYSRWTSHGGHKTRLDTFRYDTSVPDWGSGFWYDICAVGLDSFEAPSKLDVDHGEASPAVLERLAQVRAALARRAQKKAEADTLRREGEARREQHALWHGVHFKIEQALLKACCRGEFEKVDELARQLHDSHKVRPPR